MAKRKSSLLRKAVILCVVALAVVGGYMLFDKYNKPVVEHTTRAAQHTKKAAKHIEEGVKQSNEELDEAIEELKDILAQE